MKLLKVALVLGGVLTASGCLLDAPDPTVDPDAITFNDLAVHEP